jgi:hypothetical protein
VTVFFRVARPLAWPDARENVMTVSTAREVSEDGRVGQDATASMEKAAKAGNPERAPAILAAVGPGSS